MIAYNEKHPQQLTNYRIDRMRAIQTLNKGYINVQEQFDIQNEICLLYTSCHEIKFDYKE